jgi:hypothetical protein
MRRRAVEMTVCDRPVHGLALLAISMHRPLTALGKLAGASLWCLRQATNGEFSTVPQPLVRENEKKGIDRNETDGIT